jgi:hypothetical protein
MDVRQWIINQASKLRKQFPQDGGVHAIVRVTPQQTTLNEGFEGDPTADTRPDFVKQDEIGWQRLGAYKSK